MNLIPQLPENVRAIDLSGYFRINNADVFRELNKLEHDALDLQKRFVYGLTETNREQIKSAKYIANPGCFATATLLALAPLGSNALIKEKVIVDATTNSSGSGAKAAANTHHPQRANSFYAYKPLAHQHVPEIEQHLKLDYKFWNNDFVARSLRRTRHCFNFRRSANRNRAHGRLVFQRFVIGWQRESRHYHAGEIFEQRRSDGRVFSERNDFRCIKTNDLGTIFGGGMLAMAAVAATLDAIKSDKMRENIGEAESYLRERLKEIETVKTLRGKGGLLGIEFAENCKPIHQKLLANKIITKTSSDPNGCSAAAAVCEKGRN